jgi:hypothetical protein
MKITKKFVVWMLLFLTIIIGAVAAYFAYQFTRPTILPQTGCSCGPCPGGSGTSTCSQIPNADCTGPGENQTAHCDVSPTEAPNPNPTNETNPPPGGLTCDADKGGGAVGRIDTYICPNGCGGDGQCTGSDPGAQYTQGQVALGGSCGQQDKYNTSGGYCGIVALNCGGSCAGTTSTNPPPANTNPPPNNTNPPVNTSSPSQTPTSTPTGTLSPTATPTLTGTLTNTPTGTITPTTHLPGTALISDEIDRLIIGAILVLAGFWIYALDGHRILGNMFWNRFGGMFGEESQAEKFESKLLNREIKKNKK